MDRVGATWSVKQVASPCKLPVYTQIVLELHYANKEGVIPYMNVSNQQEVGCESESKERGVVNFYM